MDNLVPSWPLRQAFGRDGFLADDAQFQVMNNDVRPANSWSGGALAPVGLDAPSAKAQRKIGSVFGHMMAIPFSLGRQILRGKSWRPPPPPPLQVIQPGILSRSKYKMIYSKGLGKWIRQEMQPPAITSRGGFDIVDSVKNDMPNRKRSATSKGPRRKPNRGKPRKKVVYAGSPLAKKMGIRGAPVRGPRRGPGGRAPFRTRFLTPPVAIGSVIKGGYSQGSKRKPNSSSKTQKVDCFYDEVVVQYSDGTGGTPPAGTATLAFHDPVADDFYHGIPTHPDWFYYTPETLHNFCNCYGRYKIESMKWKYRPRVGTSNDISVTMFSTPDVCMPDATGITDSTGDFPFSPNMSRVKEYKDCTTFPSWSPYNFRASTDKKWHPMTINWGYNTPLNYEDPLQTSVDLRTSCAGITVLYGNAPPDVSMAGLYKAVGDMYLELVLRVDGFGTTLRQPTDSFTSRHQQAQKMLVLETLVEAKAMKLSDVPEKYRAFLERRSSAKHELKVNETKKTNDLFEHKRAYRLIHEASSSKPKSFSAKGRSIGEVDYESVEGTLSDEDVPPPSVTSVKLKK